MRFGKIATIYALAICVLLTVTSVAAPLFLSAPEGCNMSPAGYEFFELIEGPELSSAGDVVEMGSADEFSYMYNADYGHLNLTWDHNPGTEIHTQSPRNPDMPNCMEFVYFKQTVEWEYNIMPLDVDITVDYGIVMTGDFIVMTGDFYASELMFRVYVWLIDSSGDWTMIHMSFPPYVNGHIGSHVISLRGFDIYDAWGGMIEDDAGHQKDPSDELIFAIGLAPTDYFVHYYVSPPWLTYDGSVTLMVTHFDALVLLGETLPEERIQPLENKTWGSTDRNEQVLGLDVTSDGAIYTVGFDMPADDPYTSEETNLLLVKWDSQANVSWAQSVDNDSEKTVSYAVAAHDNYVYTVGGSFGNTTFPTTQIDMLLIKWHSNGTKLLERRYGFADTDLAIGADTGPDGSLYVVYVVQQQSPTYIMETRLGKFDSSLDMIRSVLIPHRLNYLGGLIGVANDGHVYTATGNSITKWDSGLNRIWFKKGTFVCMSVAPNGYVYAVHAQSMTMYPPYELWEPRLVVWQTEKEPITNVSLASSYGNLWEEDIIPGALTTTADGNAYFRFYAPSSGGITHYLAKYDIYGNQIWKRTMSDNTYPTRYGFYPGLMDCDSSGGIYMASTSDAMDIRLLVYLDPSYSGWGFFNIPLGDVTNIALYSAAVILIVFVVVDFTRRRRRAM